MRSMPGHHSRYTALVRYTHLTHTSHIKQPVCSSRRQYAVTDVGMWHMVMHIPPQQALCACGTHCVRPLRACRIMIRRRFIIPHVCAHSVVRWRQFSHVCVPHLLCVLLARFNSKYQPTFHHTLCYVCDEISQRSAFPHSVAMVPIVCEGTYSLSARVLY